MKIVFSSGIIYKANAVTDPFLLAFLNNFCLRKACHECKYTCLNREGDVTLGDFGGYVSDTYKFRNDEKGISLVIINTAEGADWLKKIESGYYYTRKDIEETLPSNGPLTKPSIHEEKRELFLDDFINEGFEYCLHKYLYPRERSKSYLIGMFINNKSYLLGKPGRKVYEKLRNLMKTYLRKD